MSALGQKRTFWQRGRLELIGQPGESQRFGEPCPDAFVLHSHPRLQAGNRKVRFNFEQFPDGLSGTNFLAQTCEACCEDTKRDCRTWVLCQRFFVPKDGFVILPRYKMSHPYARIYEPRSWVTGAQPVGTMKVL